MSLTYKKQRLYITFVISLMKSRRIIPTKTTNLRRAWLEKLGGLESISVKNKEWVTLLEEDTRHSLMIEGYFVSRAEIKNVINNPQYNKEGYKILGYFDSAVSTYEFAFQQYKTQEFNLTKATIRQIHSMMFRGDPNFMYTPGDWRKGKVEIVGAQVKTSLTGNIDRDIDFLCKIANKPHGNLIRKVAIVHNMFEQIHPFPDGNGRVGRILLNFILISHGLPNIAIKGFNKNRQEYIQALEQADPITHKILKEKSLNAFSKPVILLEELINTSLAHSMDIVICNRYSQIKELVSVADLAEKLGKSTQSVRVACSQKKHICSEIDGKIKTHPDLLSEPDLN